MQVELYSIIDDLLKLTSNKQSNIRSKMNDSEIIFTYIYACRLFGGNFFRALENLSESGMIKKPLEKSRFNRRLHKLKDKIIDILDFISQLTKKFRQNYSIDTFPVPVCDNIRILRSKIVKGEKYRGYNSSKKRYYYGFKVHVLTSSDGFLVELAITPASFSDTFGFDILNFDLPKGSNIFADKIYNDYYMEEMLSEAEINLMPIRKKNSKKKDNNDLENFIKQKERKYIETSFSCITRLFPKKIHAVTEKGFVLKIIGFIFAYNLSKLI